MTVTITQHHDTHEQTTLTGLNLREAKAIARDYWADRMDPDEAERNIAALFRLNSYSMDRNTAGELAMSFIEECKPE